MDEVHLLTPDHNDVNPDAADSDTANPQTPRTTPRWRRLLTAGLATVLVLSGAGAVAGYSAAVEVPSGTTVLGIDIGDRDAAGAATALREGLAARSADLGRELTVRVGEHSAAVRPADVGLDVDVDAT